MPNDAIITDRLNNAFKLAKSRYVDIVNFRDFYFGFYLPHEKIDSYSQLKVSYVEIFKRLEAMGVVREEGLIHRVIIP
jgi:hypothetical protein